MQKDLFNERVIKESFKKDCDIGNKTLYALCKNIRYTVITAKTR